MYALGLVVSEKKIFYVFLLLVYGANDPRDRAISDPMGMISGINIELHMTLLHT